MIHCNFMMAYAKYSKKFSVMKYFNRKGFYQPNVLLYMWYFQCCSLSVVRCWCIWLYNTIVVYDIQDSKERFHVETNSSIFLHVHTCVYRAHKNYLQYILFTKGETSIQKVSKPRR